MTRQRITSRHKSRRGRLGYDPKIMRMIVRLRRMETHARQEQDAVLETYRAALGLE